MKSMKSWKQACIGSLTIALFATSNAACTLNTPSIPSSHVQEDNTAASSPVNTAASSPVEGGSGYLFFFDEEAHDTNFMALKRRGAFDGLSHERLIATRTEQLERYLCSLYSAQTGTPTGAIHSNVRQAIRNTARREAVRQANILGLKPDSKIRKKRRMHPHPSVY